jgi:hypothetical protein
MSWFRYVVVVTTIFLLENCAPPPSLVSNVSPASIPKGYGRIGIYRLYEPSVSSNVANVDLNGVRVESLLPWGTVYYQDLPPGEYRVTVENSVAANDSKDLVVSAGQNVFAKIVVADSFLSGGGTMGVHREGFFVWLVARDQAQDEVVQISTTKWF